MRFEIHDSGIGILGEMTTQLFQAYPGRWFVNAQIRRDRFGTGDRQAAGGNDAGSNWRGAHTGKRFNFWFTALFENQEASVKHGETYDREVFNLRVLVRSEEHTSELQSPF